MKKISTILFIILFSLKAFSQAPQKMSYQAVIRNNSNLLVANTTIGMKISLLQGSTSGTIVYAETQNPVTNANGLISLQIGGGNLVSGNFNTINWANGPYFIKTETDPTGGTNYTIIGISQLLSVPYALYAGNVVNYSAGNGISLISGTITNSAPNQTVNLSANGISNITGSYPNYTVNTPNYLGGNGIAVNGNTITNTTPNQTVNLSANGISNIIGSYPNYTINTPNHIGGNGIAVSGNTIINTAPNQTINLFASGISSVTSAYPNYTINTPNNYYGQRMILFTSTSTFVIPNGVTSVIVELWGGGGGGGKNSNNSVAGGSAGGYGKGPVTVIPGQTYTVTVGTGGTGICSSCGIGSGGNGTNSIFGSIYATGGNGGGINLIGSPGTSNALININGGSGVNNGTPGYVFLNYGYGNGGYAATMSNSASSSGVGGLVIIYY